MRARNWGRDVRCGFVRGNDELYESFARKQGWRFTARCKCDNVGPKLFILFGRLFGHNSRFTNSFGLRICVVRVQYHMQVWETTRHSRKFIRKSVGGGMVGHMSEVEWKFSKNWSFRGFWDIWIPQELQIRIERIKRIQFGGANCKIDETLMACIEFFDFRLSDLSRQWRFVVMQSCSCVRVNCRLWCALGNWS